MRSAFAVPLDGPRAQPHTPNEATSSTIKALSARVIVDVLLEVGMRGNPARVMCPGPSSRFGYRTKFASTRRTMKGRKLSTLALLFQFLNPPHTTSTEKSRNFIQPDKVPASEKGLVIA